MNFTYNNNIEIDGKKLDLPLPPIGFHNTGAICYFNSLIQCVLSSTNFIKFILDDKKEPLFTEFLKNITEDNWDMIFTTKLLRNHNIIQGNQSSSEYFIFMIDLLKLEDIFECHHKLISKCVNCGFIKESKDITYNTLINNDIKEFFHYTETIENVNCDNCKIKSDIQRKRIVEGIPPVIVLSFNKYFGKKNVYYPEFFSNDEVSYRLVGTVEHFGVLGAGHYISRISRGEKYYLIDDSRTSEIKDIRPTPETYMIFYERIR